MDAEKIERYGSLLALAEKMNQALSVLAEDPEDEQALEEVSCAFGTLQPHLSGELSDRILSYTSFRGLRLNRRICGKPAAGFLTRLLKVRVNF